MHSSCLEGIKEILVNGTQQVKIKSSSYTSSHSGTSLGVGLSFIVIFFEWPFACNKLF